jgi:hypothetical protein
MNTNNLEREVKDLRKEMKSFASIVANKPSVIMNQDKGGYTNFLVGKSSRKEMRNNKFTHKS